MQHYKLLHLISQQKSSLRQKQHPSPTCESTAQISSGIHSQCSREALPAPTWQTKAPKTRLPCLVSRRWGSTASDLTSASSTAKRVQLRCHLLQHLRQGLSRNPAKVQSGEVYVIGVSWVVWVFEGEDFRSNFSSTACNIFPGQADFKCFPIQSSMLKIHVFARSFLA